MLLVDDDEPEVADGREDRRARADAHARLARPQPRPLVVALPGRELGVQDGDGVAEAVGEARDDLRRQPDLGDEHDDPAAALERRRREQLRTRAVNRSRARRITRNESRGKVRFSVLLVCLTITVVTVVVAMFETLYYLLG